MGRLAALLAAVILQGDFRQAAGQSFVRSAKSPFQAGLGPNGGVTADFNNDGSPDILAVSAGTGAVSVLLNDGTGALIRSPALIATVALPGPITCGDFDLDGNVDFVIAERGNLRQRVYLGSGRGTFVLKNLINGPSGPTAVADFNQDGRPDIAAASPAGRFTVWLGDGSGDFTGSMLSEFGPTAPIADLAIADFNGDRLLDVASLAGDGVSISLGDGRGGFYIPSGPFQIPIPSGFYSGPGSAAIDVWIEEPRDGLSRTAYIAVVHGGNRVSLYSQKLFEQFSQRATVTVAGGDAATVDLHDITGDGFPEILTATTNGGLAVIARKQDNPLTLSQVAGSPFGVSGQTQSILPADYDRDGRIDIATLSGGVADLVLNNWPTFIPVPTRIEAYATGTPLPVSVRFSNAGTGTGPTIGIAVNNAAAGIEFNTPACPFLCLSSPAGGLGSGWALAGSAESVILKTQHVTKSSSASEGLNSDSYALNTHGRSRGVAGMDFARTGRRGFATLSRDRVPLFQCWGSNTFAGGGPAGGADGSIAVADFNQDGLLDVAAAVYTPADSRILGGSIYFGDGTCGTLPGVARFATGGGVFGLAAGDLNGDGYPDLVTADRDSNSVTVLLNNGFGTLAPAQTITGLLAPKAVVTGDFNRDGRVDIAVANSASARVTILTGDGRGRFTASAEYGTGEGPAAIVSADLNGDYEPDLVTANFDSGTISVLLGRLTGGFSNAPGGPSATGGRNPNALAVGDLNRDGKPDLAVSNLSGGIAVLVGNGAGGFSLLGRSGGYSSGVAIGDFDSDGITDIVTQSFHRPEMLRGSTSTPQYQTVSLEASPAGAVAAGQSIVLTARVTTNGIMFGGSGTLRPVVFYDNGIRIGVENASPDGIATLRIPAPSVGSHVYSAGVFSPATSVQVNVQPGSVSILSGSPQTTPAVAPFPVPLSVRVLDAAGRPVEGVTVQFAAPKSGAPVRFANSTPVTNVQGVATTSAIANKYGGQYEVTATASGYGGTVRFLLTNSQDLATPSIISPVNNSGLSKSIVRFAWTEVPGATKYELRLFQTESGYPFRVELLGQSTTSAIYTISSGEYRLEVLACNELSCGLPAVSEFSLYVNTVPDTEPRNMTCQNSNDAGQNRVTCQWTPVPFADHYFVQAVIPGVGPGGGSLTVGSKQTSEPNVTLTVPNGPIAIVVHGCTGDGCGPYGSAPVDATFGSPRVPILATPISGSLLEGAGADAPRAIFAWNRVAGDNGSNFDYRLYVQDFSRNSAALDVITPNNFYSAFVNGGTRYDVVVIAIPRDGSAPRQGPASAFIARGNSTRSPVAVAPAFGSTTVRDAQGRVFLSWTPVLGEDWTPGNRLYQYFVGGSAQISGITENTFAFVPLQPGSYQAVMRSCWNGMACTATSEFGWGPWNNAPGSNGGIASFTVR